MSEITDMKARVVSIKTKQALKKKGETIALEVTVNKMLSLGFIATAAIPIRLREIDDDAFVVDSFLMVFTQMDEDSDTVTADNDLSDREEVEEVEEVEESQKDKSEPENIATVNTDVQE